MQKHPRYGIIDLGTNTFHLLIAEAASDGALKILFRKREFVKLAEEGIQMIGEAPFQRGLETMNRFREWLAQYGVKDARAIGTAALRTAGNGEEFIRRVAAETGIQVELIDGDREAALIHRGVAQAVPFDRERKLIMDIGGGSVEFIIADVERVYWAESFPLGVAVLYRDFHREEPIAPTSIERLQAFLTEQLLPLQNALEKLPCRQLVGASGTFDVLENILGEQAEGSPRYTPIPVAKLPPLHRKIIHSRREERHRMEGVPAVRADMIVVAMILIEHIIRMAHIREIIVSNFALKEGVLYEMIRAAR